MSVQHQGIAVAYGPKLLKAKVHVLGRFLLRPDEEFNAVVARQLIAKARQRRVKVSTELRVFDRGIQLGDYGVFASMPIEFIKYHRLADLTTLTNEPSILTVCVRDYEQKCVTVLQFKDASRVGLANELVHKHRAAYLEEYAKLSEQGGSSTLQRGGAHLNGGAADRTTRDDTVDGANRQRGRPREPDYVAIRKRQQATGALTAPPPPPPPPQPSTTGANTEARGAFFTRITVPAGQQKRQQLVEEVEEQKRESLHQQYQVRRSQLLAQQDAAGRRSGSFDELEMAAVFETLDGPPTVLNEPAVYADRTARRPRPGDGDERPQEVASWRLADRHFKTSGQPAVAQ